MGLQAPPSVDLSMEYDKAEQRQDRRAGKYKEAVVQFSKKMDLFE